jgi:hypothetical protein
MWRFLSPYGIHITSAYDLQKILPNPKNNHILSLYDPANSIIGTNLEKKKRKKYKKKGRHVRKIRWTHIWVCQCSIKLRASALCRARRSSELWDG